MKIFFNFSKKLLPKISNTELIALRSGTVSIDKNIIENTVDKFNFKNLKTEIDENSYNSQVNNLIKNVSSQPVFKNGKMDSNFMDNIKKTKAFSYIIEKKYGGHEFNVNTQSKILTKLTSYNPSLGVTVMVPNSLGPGELLHNYGTKLQKNNYLPKLASGEMIPCFGLTGPNNGSDAIGSIDKGVVVKKNNKVYIELSINKRYITMAPISNLVGLAFNLEDPDNLLKDGKEGVTVALLEKGHEGLKQETYHNPSNVGFPNGTLKGDLKIELDQVIGGEKNCGEGWKMLMECLAAGRGVSLPASALGTALTITYGVSGYANLRKQFNIPLSKMQGIQEKLARMTYNSLLIDSSIKLTNNILDSGEKPSVVSAIMKQQTTERARKVLLDGMDIYAGSAICLGENNFIEKFYNSAPVGITVEGSNTLTRSLIIFGQGLNKSHPYIGNIVQSIMNDDNKNFNKYFRNMVNYTILSYFDSLLTLTSFKTYEIDYFYKINTTFTNLVNIVSLQGGKLKKDQILSGHMADIFSNLYMGYSLIYNFDRLNLDKKTKEICMKMLINELIDSLNEIKNLLPINLKLLIIGHYNYKKLTINSKDNEYLANIVWNNEEINKYIEEQIYLDPDNILKIKKCNEEFDLSLYQDIISVGEFKLD